MHHYRDLIQLFEQTFYLSENTRLVRGDDEPVYLPADQHCRFHQVVFAHGYYASALHEIAHWCIAGKRRRLLEDYGYWYNADGRDFEQQRAFEQVEIKPQAIECAFSQAAGVRFTVSTDNLTGAQPDTQSFTTAVYNQLDWYRQNGFPPRAQRFIDALSQYYCSTKNNSSNPTVVHKVNYAPI